MIILSAIMFYVDWKHERMIEKENMSEGIIKRNSINDCDKW